MPIRGAVDSGEASGRLGAGVARALGLAPSDLAVAMLGALCSWLVMASYYMLRPLRDEIGAAGAGELAWMFWATFVGTLIASPLFSVLVARLPRPRFVGLAFRFFGVNLIGFAAAFGVLNGEALRWSEYAFFAWLSVFNLFIVSLVWSLMADVSHAASGKRSFGVIAAGSSLGAIAGAGAVAGLGQSVPRLAFIAASVVLLEGAVWVALLIDRRAPAEPAREQDDLDRVGRGGASTFGAALAQLGAGAALVARSPYLALICAYLLLHTFAGTAMYFAQSEIVGSAFADRGERRAYLASIDLWLSVVALVGQAFLAGRVMSRVGTWLALVLLPVVSGGALLALGLGRGGGGSAASLLTVLAVCQVTRRSASYALAKPARETLFTVVSRGEKYKAKNFIDTVVYRGGDAASASAFGAASATLAGGWLALAIAPVMAVWALVGWVLARLQAQRAMAAERDRVQPGGSSPIEPGTRAGFTEMQA